MKPTVKPHNPNFSSGPCSKRPGYELSNLRTDVLGRSHRSALGKETLAEAIALTKEILNLPEDYLVGIVPASDTGAVEMCLWSMLGARPVDMFAWESFGAGWQTDVLKQLELADVNVYNAEYGLLPDFSLANPEHDLVFTWNGTTSGVRVDQADWIADDRQGITICDATSAVFAMDMPWSKLDVTTFSWQKVLGGEGGHGVIILSPKAVERLETYKPTWPLPKIFRMTSGGKLIEGIFRGETINTPSMLCVVDYIDALNWVKSIGGVQASIARADANLAVLEAFIEKTDWIQNLAQVPSQRSNTSVCLTLNASEDQCKQMIELLAAEQVAFDIGSYKDAPAGLRIWCGATVETSDLAALLPWLEWAYHEVCAN